jgi:hypothetical protein
MLLEHKAAVFQKLREETADWRSGKRPNGGYHSPTKDDHEMKVDPVTPRLEISSPETAGREPRPSTPVKDGADNNAPKYESPSRLPPLGVFSVTTPERMLRDA